MTQNSLIYLSDIMVRAGRRKILEFSKLKIESGEFVGIIGTNGAGKTTLLKTICGLTRPSKGKVIFKQADIGKLWNWQKANLRKSIGYIPQSTQYNKELPFTVEEIVLMARAAAKSLLSRINTEDRQIAGRWINALGLSHLAQQPFRSLSGGEQQKALIARAMAQNPDILMLDEPAANLDFNWKYRITEIIEDLHKQTGVTVLMVSHETNLLPQSCSRIILLDQGLILADSAADEVFDDEHLSLAYKCPLQVRQIHGRRYLVQKPDNRNTEQLNL